MVGLAALDPPYLETEVLMCVARTAWVGIAVLVLLGTAAGVARAAKVTVDLGKAEGITLVGAFDRWDEEGNARKLLDGKEKLDIPLVAFKAADAGDGKWVFKSLPPGKYDLVIMGDGRRRIEGFTFPPVLEYDPFFTVANKPDDDAADWILNDIRHSQHYENKVEPLYHGGDDKAVRILMMLIRDRETSYEGDMPGAATMRFEVWQYDFNYGGWVKNKRTVVLHRAILTRGDLRQWTWVWDPKLGGIRVGKSPLSIKYDVPSKTDKSLKGLYPY
jgi:hypothetical protein